MCGCGCGGPQLSILSPSPSQVTESRDPDGLRNFYYLVQDLKTLVISLMNAHFKINPYS